MNRNFLDQKHNKILNLNFPKKQDDILLDIDVQSPEDFSKNDFLLGTVESIQFNDKILETNRDKRVSLKSGGTGDGVLVSNSYSKDFDSVDPKEFEEVYSQRKSVKSSARDSNTFILHNDSIFEQNQ